MKQDKNKPDLKIFLIKLIAITFSIIIIINITYNLIFADKLETINKVMNMNNKESVEQIKGKIRLEIRKGLEGNICRCTGYQNIVASVKGAIGKV